MQQLGAFVETAYINSIRDIKMPWDSKLVDCDVDFDTSNLAGKTAIVTGGANGLGQAYVRALVDAKYAKGVGRQVISIEWTDVR